ncbi:hypothetical protein DFH07DRAFT_405096 [Mycena maculata]|uniref:CP-type G domain-containing protein n=1 Tax=Mycena maculata TaxID=230809 RepID=A0AAD7JE73_9AGAR|nr:hypothetical protein DFH07DRAFT_405096 [Mycena maculata]
MPRIRKKTSNRGSTNERKKILHKVRESRKKKVKASKKSVQWKSKHKKDPGIPNNFPYKDQILAEIADQRRVAAEEKQRKKDLKKGKKTDAESDVDEDAGSNNSDANDEENDNGDEVFAEVKALGLAQGFDGIASLSAKRLDNTKLRPRQAPTVEAMEDGEEDVPVLMNPAFPNLQAVLEQADVVLQVLDARDPLPFRSAHLEELAAAHPGQRVLFVLNKIDACPRESVASWAAHLRTEHATLPFRAASAFLPAGPELLDKTIVKGKGKGKARADDALGADTILARLGEWAEQKTGDEPLCVAVIGVTNVGKSALVNSLLRKATVGVYTLAGSSRGPTTTAYAQEVALEVKGRQIRLVDTPGISWSAPAAVPDADADVHMDDAQADDIRARDILLRSKGRIDRLKDPILAVKHIISRANTEDLMLLYSLPAFSARDTDAFLASVARAHQLVKKKGELDLTGAARAVLRDWSVGKFPRFTVPPAAAGAATEMEEGGDEAVLAGLQTRKELRKTKGLVKFVCGAIETRRAAVEEIWVPVTREKDDESEGVDEEDEDMEDGGDEEQDDDDEMDDGGEEEDEEEEEEEPQPMLSGKQKRKRATEKNAPPPRKKVSFGPDPKASKQARKASSLARKPAAVAPAAAQKTPKPLTSKSAAPAKDKDRKVANTAIKTKSKPQKIPGATTAGGEEYDFGKFF